MRGFLGSGLITLGVGLAVNSLLGPLVLGVIRYRFSESLLYQGMGLDAVSLALVAPLAVVAGVLTLRDRSAGPALGLGIGAYSAYMAIQYVVGPEYLELSGNNERFFLLHLGLFALGSAVVAGAWTYVDDRTLPPGSARGARRWGALMIALGLLLLLRYLPALLELAAGDPSLPEYRENPTSFLLIATLDLGVFFPAAVVTGVVLRRGRRRGRKALHLVLGWFALVGPAVGAMATTMWLHDDPEGSVGRTLAFFLVGVAFLALWAGLIRHNPDPE